MRKLFILVLILSSHFLIAQTDNNQVIDSLKVLSDSITKQDAIHQKETEFVEHELAIKFDSLWLSEMYCSPLIDDSREFILDESEIEDVDSINLPTALLKERLALLDRETPFNVEYNSSLEKIIKSYLKNRRKTLSIMMSRAEYYFPMFEEHLAKYDIPMELKYLAIVESALRPRANSPVGARGLWQFMYQTGIQFDLNVSSYIDDRQDPIKSTEAACQYLSLLYRIFDDWDLALAAYNSGPGNVNKAIRRSGGRKNYWNIRAYLPRETAGYVPAFYATMYIFEYADAHDLKAKQSHIKTFETDTVHIKKQVTFDQLSKLLDIDVEMIEFLNPQYKLNIIPYREGKNYFVRLPVYEVGKFISNEDVLFKVIEEENKKREQTLPEYVEMQDRIRYKVRSGDYLGKIADKYGVRVSDIKRWNGLRNNNLRVGQRLTIYPKRIPKPKTQTTNNTSNSKPKKIVVLDKEFVTYTVKSGDSLWLISQDYPNVSVQNLREWNGIWKSSDLKPGMKLKIYKI